METREDWFGGFAVFAVLLLPVGTSLFSSEIQRKYSELREQLELKMMPPAWLLGPVWLAVCALMTISIVLWSHKPEIEQHGALWVWTWISIVVNIAAVKFWSPLMFDVRGGQGLHIFAAVDATLWLLSGVAVLVLFCISTPTPLLPIIFWSICLFVMFYVAVMSFLISRRKIRYVAVSAV